MGSGGDEPGKMKTTVSKATTSSALLAGTEALLQSSSARCLDRAPRGRNETGVWWRRHDAYGQL
jgi:predicted dithiol-disulfide oxidoreductase (DUF899 family)